MSKREFTLSIETAVEGGSISLLQDDYELDYWIGRQKVSRSEDVLEEIKKILERNGLTNHNLKKIAVSTGPGSVTGVRIGIAIGYGLKKSLNCKMVGLSVMRGILRANDNLAYNVETGIIVAFPLGSEQICWQHYKNNETKVNTFNYRPQIAKVGDFFNSLNNKEAKFKGKLILHHKTYLAYQQNKISRLFKDDYVINAGENIAGLIGKAVTTEREYEIARPIYIKDNAIF